MAEIAKISVDFVRKEVDRARNKTEKKEIRQQEQTALNPATQMQRRSANRIAYDNVKAGRAEERIIASLLLDTSLLNLCKDLTPEMYSVALYRKVYQQILEYSNYGADVSIGTLTDLSKEEMSHLVRVYSKNGPVDEVAFCDCVRTVIAEYRAKFVHQSNSEEDILAFQRRLKESKGTKE